MAILIHQQTHTHTHTTESWLACTASSGVPSSSHASLKAVATSSGFKSSRAFGVMPENLWPHHWRPAVAGQSIMR
eukprot:1158805-Pelagomonas_calceolata.AAC.7